jgi:hypothetical protein
VASAIIDIKNADGTYSTRIKPGSNLDSNQVNPELKALVQNIVSSDTSKHYKYCPCCRNYEKNEELNAE